MMFLSDDKQADIIDAFNTTSRYLDDISNINNSNSMFFIVFSAILIGPLVKLNGFYTSIKTRAYEYLISALIPQL